jgi:Flp pilus assembly protein TadG
MTAMSWFNLRHRGWNAGNSAIEFALVAPFIIFLAVGTADYGIASYERMAAQHAAQIGAEQAALHGFDTAAITNAVQTATAFSTISATPAPTQSCGCVSGAAFSDQACGTACPDGTNAGTYVTVSAQLFYRTILPYPGIPDSFTFTEASFVRIQ